MARKAVIPPVNQDQLKRAVVLLLDLRYGKQRTRRIREILNGEVVTRNHPFRDDMYALNTILDFARTISMSAALRMLDDADETRGRLAAQHMVEGRLDEVERERRRTYLKDLRERKGMAVKIEELRRGRTFSASEKVKFLEDTVSRWTVRRDRFISEHPEMNRLEATKAFTEQLRQELHEKLERAKASGPIKVQSQKSTPKNALPSWKRELSGLRTKK